MRSLVLKMMRAISIISQRRFQYWKLNLNWRWWERCHLLAARRRVQYWISMSSPVHWPRAQLHICCWTFILEPKRTQVWSIFLSISFLFNSFKNIRWICQLNKISPRKSKLCWARYNNGGRPVTKVRWPWWWIITGVVRKLKQCTTVKRHVNTERFGVSRRI